MKRKSLIVAILGIVAGLTGRRADALPGKSSAAFSSGRMPFINRDPGSHEGKGLYIFGQRLTVSKFAKDGDQVIEAVEHEGEVFAFATWQATESGFAFDGLFWRGDLNGILSITEGQEDQIRQLSLDKVLGIARVGWGPLRCTPAIKLNDKARRAAVRLTDGYFIRAGDYS